jgi:hypothetical protein
MHAWRIDENDLVFRPGQDAEDAMTRGLWLGTDNADFAFQQGVQQRGFADIRSSDDGREAAAIRRRDLGRRRRPGVWWQWLTHELARENFDSL